MEFLHEFGVEWTLFLAQVVNFLIVFFILKKFLYKPILGMLKSREDAIKKGIDDSEQARILLEKAEERERVLLKKAQVEAKELLADARKQADDIIAKSEEKTKLQVEKMLKDAREQITSETREAEKRLTKDIGDLAVTYLRKSVDELFTDKDQEAVMSKAIKTLQKNKN